MPRTNVAAQVIPATYYPATPLAGGAADLTLVPADIVNNNSTVIVDGKTRLVALNSGATSHTVTIHSQPDAQNRIGDITTYAVAAGKISRWGPFKTAGWANATLLEFEANNVEILFAVEQLP